MQQQGKQRHCHGGLGRRGGGGGGGLLFGSSTQQQGQQRHWHERQARSGLLNPNYLPPTHSHSHTYARTHTHTHTHRLGDSAAAAADNRDRLTGRQWFTQQEGAGVEVSEEPRDDDEE